MNLIIDTHTHTVASGHAYSTVKENFESAEKNGLKAVGITDHSILLPGGAAAYHFTNLSILPEYISNVKLYKGIELNIIDYKGTVDDYDHEINCDILMNIDYCIASLHPPCLPFSTEENITNTLLKVMDNPNVNIIGHLGDPRYRFDIDKVISYAKETNTAIELNCKSLDPTNMRYDIEFMQEIMEALVKYDPYISIGTDTHYCDEIGIFDNAINLMKDYPINESKIINTSLELFEKFITLK